MADASHIEVLKPGLATSVQDKGRQGYHLGIPPSGALDQYALAAANLLVGNAEDAAVLECTLLGPELLFHRAALIAVTGATMAPKIDGKPMPCNMALAVPAGSRLSFEFVSAGARLPGRGRRHRRAGGAGQPFDLYTGRHRRARGRRLKAGDKLAIGQPSRARAGRELPLDLAAHCPKTQTLRVLPGLYDHRLEPESAATFYQDAWTVTSEADRIGYRYKQGRALRFREREQPFGAGADPSNIVDACYPIGSIQVPAGVEPIILHRDAVSGGGYAMIGTVISADMDRSDRCSQPERALRKVTLEQALVARREHHARYDRLRQALSG